jgi:hypothetical protein
MATVPSTTATTWRPEVVAGGKADREAGVQPCPGARTGRNHAGDQSEGRKTPATVRPVAIGQLLPRAPQGNRAQIGLSVFDPSARVRCSRPGRSPAGGGIRGPGRRQAALHPRIREHFKLSSARGSSGFHPVVQAIGFRHDGGKGPQRQSAGVCLRDPVIR